MSKAPEKFDGRHRSSPRPMVYFDGEGRQPPVLGRRRLEEDDRLIYPGSFHFTTNAAEVMAIVAGACRVRLKGESAWRPYAAGTSFPVAANSAFDIEVESGIRRIRLLVRLAGVGRGALAGHPGRAHLMSE